MFYIKFGLNFCMLISFVLELELDFCFKLDVFKFSSCLIRVRKQLSVYFF